MAVFRIEKTRDYTVMSNYHLRDMSLSLKAKGLLSLMLSLPENWDYTMKGLARICKDGIDSISGGIRELEAHGYLIRARVRGANGQLGSIEYTILEQPKTPSPTQEKPIRENPVQANPMLDAPIQENPAQLNKEESSNYLSKTDLSITEGSSPIQSSPPAPRERIGQDGMRKRESYRALILENIEYDVLSQNVQLDKDRLDELVELMVDTVCSNREMIRVAGDDYPAEVVRSRFLKLNTSHIEYVLDRMRENTTYVRNIKKYLLAALYNAPVTMDSLDWFIRAKQKMMICPKGGNSMTTLIQYLQRVLIVAIPAVLVFLCFTPYRMKALSAMNLHTSRKHEAGLILFVTSIFGVLALTLWPTYIWMDSPGVWGDIRILIDRPTWKSNLSLIPFTVFKDYIEDLFKSPVFFFATLINFFGNLAIFVPIGFFPALLFRDANWKRSAIIGFGMSALIELAQYFIMRNVAVDDIILNTAGAICGYLLYLFIRKHWTNFTDGFLCREVSKG